MANKIADWSIMRNTVIGFLVCVTLAAGMLSASYYFKENMQRQYQLSHSDFRNASQQYLAVDEEERIIEEFYPEFVRLYRRGLIGKERRLSWIESLRSAGAVIKIPELNYKLDAQREIAPDFYLALGSYGVYVSAMNLSLGLLHEGDLLRLFAALERDAQGQYTVKDCDLRLTSGEFTIDSTRANIHAECTLEWLTIDLSGDEELVL
jgi:hypothetical protein